MHMQLSRPEKVRTNSREPGRRKAAEKSALNGRAVLTQEVLHKAMVLLSRESSVGVNLA